MEKTEAKKHFFSEEQEKAIIDAIVKAEDQTSGEIRVHVQSWAGPDPLDTAGTIFHAIGMNQTRLRNGVLIFLAVQDQQFSILGDEGIHEKVGQDFWDDVRNLMLEQFRKGDFQAGLTVGIQKVGEKLKAFFPCEPDDINELPDCISYGDEPF